LKAAGRGELYAESGSSISDRDRNFGNMMVWVFGELSEVLCNLKGSGRRSDIDMFDRSSDASKPTKPIIIICSEMGCCVPEGEMMSNETKLSAKSEKISEVCNIYG